MSVRWLAVIALSFLVGIAYGNNVRQAVAVLSAGPVTGTILFAETSGGVAVTGRIEGLPAGQYGFHIHELGDTMLCDNAGPHFNPQRVNHGGPNHNVRHVGDLGNVQFTSAGLIWASTINVVDRMIALRGRNNILGRAVVLHAQPDDLGLGGHETSLTTGNAGARVACAVIGIHAPVEAWNSSVQIVPSALLLLVLALLRFFN